MNELERRIRQLLNQLSTGFSKWWGSTAARRTKLRHEATERASTALNDLRDSGAGKRAATTMHDLRDSQAGKRTASALHDLRESPAGKRTASALTDLRQREPLRKAEESARRALQDLRSGNGDSSSGGAAAS
jgi:hypothetical protein